MCCYISKQTPPHRLFRSRRSMSSLRLFAVCLLALSFASLTVQSQTCGFGDYDFSSLKGHDFQGSDGSPTYNYFLSVCGTVSNQVCLTGTGGAPQASACQLTVQDSTPYVAGLWPTAQPFPTWGYVDPSNPDIGVMYQMVGTQNCHATNPASLYYANILFVCAEKQGDLKVEVPMLGCTQNYTLPTPLACPGSGGGGGGGGGDDGGKKHLSGGWIFIIILCVVIPVYVVVGCVYKSQKLGATGIDRCPNVEFWRDCPSLVKDGCVFTFRKLRGLCGGSGKEDSYQTM